MYVYVCRVCVYVCVYIAPWAQPVRLLSPHTLPPLCLAYHLLAFRSELDEFGEDDFLTARSDHNRSNAGSGLAGPSNASAGMGHLLQTATHDAAGGLAPAMPATCSPVHHVLQRQPAADGSVQGAADGEGTREGTNPFRKGSGSGRLSDPPPPPDEDSAQPAQVQHA